MQNVFEGFEKRALSENAKAALLVGGLGAAHAGLGAYSGHASHVANKLDAARRGQEYKPETFIQKNPKLTGALTLGWAPLLSHAQTVSERDMADPKVRKVMKEHPFMTGV